MRLPQRDKVARARELQLRSVTEAQWQEQVVEYAHLRGWRVAHFRAAQTAKGRHMTAVAYDGAGFPDLVLARNGKVLFAELKRETGRVSVAQQAWIDELTGVATVHVYVWRPSDWDAVEAALR